MFGLQIEYSGLHRFLYNHNTSLSDDYEYVNCDESLSYKVTRLQ